MNWPASGAAYRVTMPAEPAAAVSSLNSGSSARVPFAVASTTAWAPSVSSATTAQSPSITQPPEVSSSLAAVAQLRQAGLGGVGVLDLDDHDDLGALTAGVDGGHGDPLTEPGLDVLVVEDLAVLGEVELLEELLPDVVVGVEAELLLERRELVQGAQRLDLLAAAGVEVDARVADRARRQRLGGLGAGREEVAPRPTRPRPPGPGRRRRRRSAGRAGDRRRRTSAPAPRAAAASRRRPRGTRRALDGWVAAGRAARARQGRCRTRSSPVVLGRRPGSGFREVPRHAFGRRAYPRGSS